MERTPGVCRRWTTHGLLCELWSRHFSTALLFFQKAICTGALYVHVNTYDTYPFMFRRAVIRVHITRQARPSNSPDTRII